VACRPAGHGASMSFGALAGGFPPSVAEELTRSFASPRKSSEAGVSRPPTKTPASQQTGGAWSDTSRPTDWAYLTIVKLSDFRVEAPAESVAVIIAV
jgi:hypothetical protein